MNAERRVLIRVRRDGTEREVTETTARILVEYGMAEYVKTCNAVQPSETR